MSKTLISGYNGENKLTLAIQNANPNLFVIFGNEDDFLSNLRSTFNQVKFEVLNENPRDMLDKVKWICRKIDIIEDEIFIDVSSGKDDLKQALSLSAALRKKRINNLTYIDSNNELIHLPIANLKTSGISEKILKELNVNNSNVSELAKFLNVNKSMIYNYLRKLENEGFIKSKKLTTKGKISII